MRGTVQREEPGEAEVGHLDVEVSIEEDVGGLLVKVHHGRLDGLGGRLAPQLPQRRR